MQSPTDMIDVADRFLERGYDHEFRVVGSGVRDITAERDVELADLTVEASYRFELEPLSVDASNLYVIRDRKSGAKGLLIDAFDLLDGDGPLGRRARNRRVQREDSPGVPMRYGVRRVSREEFGADPERYVLRLGFPDFPECPFGQSFSMLGFDTYEQAYVWLATSILRDDRLVRVPYQDAEVPDND